jgi:transposase-like protein
MARAVNQVLWDQWQQRMERQRASGLSIAEFCRRENLSPHNFHVWRRKLDAKMSPRRVPGGTARRSPSRKRRTLAIPRWRSRPTLAKSTMRARSLNFLQLPLTAVQSSPWIELALAEGTIVRLPQQNLAALVAVLRVLRGEPWDLSPGESDHA